VCSFPYQPLTLHSFLSSSVPFLTNHSLFILSSLRSFISLPTTHSSFFPLFVRSFPYQPLTRHSFLSSFVPFFTNHSLFILSNFVRSLPFLFLQLLVIGIAVGLALVVAAGLRVLWVFFRTTRKRDSDSNASTVNLDNSCDVDVASVYAAAPVACDFNAISNPPTPTLTPTFTFMTDGRRRRSNSNSVAPKPPIAVAVTEREPLVRSADLVHSRGGGDGADDNSVRGDVGGGDGSNSDGGDGDNACVQIQPSGAVIDALSGAYVSASSIATSTSTVDANDSAISSNPSTGAATPTHTANSSVSPAGSGRSSGTPQAVVAEPDCKEVMSEQHRLENMHAEMFGNV
jgi:hypothetical protein